MGNKKTEKKVEKKPVEEKESKEDKKLREESENEYQEGYGPPDQEETFEVLYQQKGFAVVRVDGEVYCVNSTQIMQLGFYFNRNR